MNPSLFDKGAQYQYRLNLDDPNLNSIRTLPAFQQLIRLKEKTQPKRHSLRYGIFLIQEQATPPGVVAFDPVDKTIYGGSIHKRKIIKINKKGVVSDFTTAGQNMGWAVFLDLRVDAKKRILWACSSSIPE